jgi:hypothetical protein
VTQPWFDTTTGVLLLDDYVATRPSFQRVVADDRVTDDELKNQAGHVVSLLQKAESLLSPEARQAVTEALCELAVLYELQHKQTSREK